MVCIWKNGFKPIRIEKEITGKQIAPFFFQADRMILTVARDVMGLNRNNVTGCAGR